MPLTIHPSSTTRHPPLITTLLSLSHSLSAYSFPRKPWSKFINADNKRYISDEAIDFLDKLLRYDHQERISPAEAMVHRYFGTFGTVHYMRSPYYRHSSSFPLPIPPHSPLSV